MVIGEQDPRRHEEPGAGRAVVEAVFRTGKDGELARLADELGVDPGDDDLVVRREISAEGRNRAWANGGPATVAALGRLGALLVDLHGQHDAQSLLRPAAQRDILDAMGGAEAERTRGITAEANISWFLIAIQCGAPPAFTVIAISEMPGQMARVSAMRSTMSSGVPTQT